jgi:hypothetical protein
MAFDLKTAKPVSGGFDLRTARPVGGPRPPKKPEETSFLRDLADLAISGGRAIVDLGKPFASMAQQGAPTSILPVIAGTVLSESEELLKRGRSAADIQREQIRQQTIAEEAKTPGALARGISGARQFIEGPRRPAAAETPLSGIADFISPARAIASLLPATPEAAQREVSGVTTQFASPIEAAQFFVSQAPATIATVGAGGISRAGALAQGLERAAAAKVGQQAAVRTGVTLNATDAGYNAAQDVLAKGGTQEEANRAFTIAAAGAALTSAAASKIPGVEQNVFATRPTAPGVVRSALRSALGEAPQEFVEEAGAQLAQNIGKLGTAAETDISEGVLSSGALGAIGGAGIGAGSGTVQGIMQRGEAPPTPVVPPDAEPIRTVTITYPDKEDPSKVVTRNLDVLSEPDEQGYLKARDGTGKVIDIKADDLAELEAASPAYVTQQAAPTPPPSPVVDPATIRERLRIASGVAADQNEPPRVRALANEVTIALAEDNPVAAQAAVQSRQRALAEGRMSEATRAQRQAELDEALSIINDYRVEYGRARAAGPAKVEAPVKQPESVEQALEQNAELAKRDAEAQAKRDAEEQARLRLESALESASLVAEGSPIRQAQTERQQIFDAIINDETIENPAAAFRQALRERGYPKPELNANERRQVQARLAFTKPAAIAPYIGEEISAEVIEPQPKPAPIIEGEFTEVPAPPPPTPPAVAAGAAARQPTPRAQLMTGTATLPSVGGFDIATARPVAEAAVEEAPVEAVAEAAPVEVAAEEAPAEAAVDPYENVLNEIEGAYRGDPDEDIEPSIDEKTYDLLISAAENRRGSPEEIMAALDMAQLRFAEQQMAGVETEEKSPAVEQIENEAVHDQLDEADKARLAEHYGEPEYNEVAKSRFVQDVVTAINRGLNAVDKAIRDIVKKIQATTLSVALVFNPLPLTQPTINFTQANSIAQNETLRQEVPAEARGSMSRDAQSVYERVAPIAMEGNKAFFIADKPSGMIHAFNGDGSYIASSPSLFGKKAGDVETGANITKTVDELSEEDLVTPAGTFKIQVLGNGMPGGDYAGGYILRMHNVKDITPDGKTRKRKTFVAVHSVYLKKPAEMRKERLESKTAADNKISFGCINTSTDFFLNEIVPNIKSFKGGMVFVMPDNAAKTFEYFPGKKAPEKKTPDTGLSFMQPLGRPEGDRYFEAPSGREERTLPPPAVLGYREDVADEILENPDIDPDTLELLNPVASVEGTEAIIQRLRDAAESGLITKEAADLTVWFLEQNPNLARHAQMFISAANGQPYGGAYRPMERLVEIVAGSRDIIGTHEFLHHAERLMPEAAQNRIRNLWATRLRLKRLIAKGDQKRFLNALHSFYFGDGDPESFKLASKLFADQRVPRSFYQYMSPSEFWAENAGNITQSRYAAKDRTTSKIKQWLKELASRIAGFTGVPTNSVIISELNKLAKTTGEAKSGEIIAGNEGPAFIYAGESITEPRDSDGPFEREERRILGNYLQVANEMESAGADAKTIRVATGWERNEYDGKWRYLQPDQMAESTSMFDDFIRDFDYAEGAYAMSFYPDGSADLRDILNHPELYKIYPEAGDIRVYIGRDGGDLQGYYDPDLKSIKIYASAKDPVGTLLHEVQHWVQDKEGFAFGASPSTIWDALTDEQKRIEAQAAIDALGGDLNDLSQVLDVLSYLSNDPEFGLAIEDGTALQDLEGFFGKAFDDGLIVDDRIYDLTQGRLDYIASKRQSLGLADTSFKSEDLLNELNSISEEINEKTQLIEDIKDGDPTEKGSSAEKAARTAFEEHTRRNVIRYLDTAGEIEARDVDAQRNKGQQELREAGMLASETRRPSRDRAIITYPQRGKPTESRGTPTVPPATTRGAKIAFISRLSQRMKNLYRKLAYKYVAAPNLDKQLAEALGVDQLPKQFSLEDRMSMFESMRNGLLRDFEQTWLRPFLAALEKSGIHPNDLATYLWARSAADRNAMIAERNRDMPDGGSGMTNLEAEAILAHYRSSGLMRQMEPLVKMHDRLVDWMLKQRIKSGLMSKAEVDLLRKQQPYYTPLKGFAADGDMQTSGDESPHQDYKGRAQMGVRPTDYIKATGRSSMPFNPMYNLIADAMQLTQRIARNDVGKRFLSIVQDFPDLLGDAVKVYTDDRPKIVKKGIAAPGSKKKTVGPMNMAANANKFLVVKEGGKNYYIEFDETTKDGEELKRMFDNMTPGEIDGAVGWLVKLGQFRKQLLTRFSPVFWAMNFGRDVMDLVATAYSEKTRAGSPVEGKAVALRTLNNLRKPSTWRSVWKYVKGNEPQRAEDIDNYLLISQMIADGGNSGYNEALTAEELGKKIDRQLSILKGAKPDSLWGEANDKRAAFVEAVDDINDFAGIILRFAAYKAAIDQGTPRDDAAKFALDSTLNLSRKGEATPIVDNIWIFTNPAIQSLEKKKRIYSSKNGRKAMAGMMALGIGLHFWNMAVAGDDDDDGENNYQDLDEGTKMVNLIIYPPSGGEPVKIPVGFMVAFEIYLGQQIARMISDDSSGISALRAMGNAMSAFVATQLPFGEKIGSITDLPKMVVPDVFTPVVDLWRNVNYFGSQIYPEPYYEGQAVSGMARRSTGEFYKNLAMALNRAGGGTEDIASKTDVPAEGMKYLVDQYLLIGGAALPKDAAKFFEEGAPADLTKIPVAKRFVGDNSEYAAQNKFYDRAAKVEIISGQYKGENADARAYAESKEEFPVESNPAVIKAYKDASKKLRELSKAKREAQRAGGASMEQKLERVEQDQKKVYEKFNQTYNDVKGRGGVQSFKDGGPVRAGNIDVHRRPVVRNPDGSISTVRSITVGFDDGVYVLPTVIGDRVVSDDEAIQHFRKSGEHLGVFKTEKDANNYAKRLHLEQEKEYVKGRQ